MLHHHPYPSEFLEAIRDRHACPKADAQGNRLFGAILGGFCLLAAALIAIAQIIH